MVEDGNRDGGLLDTLLHNDVAAALANLNKSVTGENLTYFAP